MLSRSLLVPASALLASFISPTHAQLISKCNPLNATCPADPALGTDHTFVFNSTPPTGTWNTTAGTVDYSDENGAAFTVAKKGDSPTIISNFYFFWGKTEVLMKAANGTGIVSSIVWSSDTLDEVDWEFLGGNISVAETNYFGKGRQDFHNAIYHPVGDVQNEWHNYTTTWTNTSMDFYIDGDKVRTLLPADANNTDNYPQTPMKVSLGIWAAGDPDNAIGTIEWAQGETNYNDGPFTMYVKSCRVEDYSTGKEYSYSDNSGDWESIKIATGNSSAVAAINATPEKTLSEKWNELPTATKNGVYAAAGCVAAILVGALAFYYFKQRKAGQREAALATQRNEQERLELEQFQREGKNPDTLAYVGTEYNAATMNKGNVNVDIYGTPGAEHSRSDSLQSAHGVPETAQGWDPTSNNGPASPVIRSPMPMMPDNAAVRNPDGYTGINAVDSQDTSYGGAANARWR